MTGRPRTRRVLRPAARVLLGLALLFAGFAHLTGARLEFRAQVPSWFRRRRRSRIP